MGKYDLSDNQWNAIKEEIPPKTSSCGRERRNPRELTHAINWVGRTGAPWSEIPAEYGVWRTAYNNFRRWTDDGTIVHIFEKIEPKSAETDEIQIDGTYIRAHQHSAGVNNNQQSPEPCGSGEIFFMGGK